ncbi:hypothetical protein M670_00454 [Schinkia azotoformans MEV2011]|uniref:Uncharacterized protein n=1 Tax=Schinkia azotoformans MEV2011 TaxID=1348973 RepID=A0A072NU72_SCHAZ|nr:hypothetical protein [Schinkia azotoformans]KEF40428.1 hypothetical protein M670_00454 [Schinkia azotoformans MEV2011]MEC1696162.1 hypothetical protein [Schinkia azotoformans]MEC1725335.1 hypothetical protein [Schinkia azotoformans]MEC1739461.1 hypothetical protein [Schinkia azotoformans]MEC1745469.1 hypothetical protein [Schinkia azotoformans]
MDVIELIRNLVLITAGLLSIYKDLTQIREKRNEKKKKRSNKKRK